MTFDRLAAAALIAVFTATSAMALQNDGAATPGKDVESLSLVGCLEKAPDGSSFVLTHVRPAPAGEGARTSAGAGASVTGEAPSGRVSGDTPTGSTSTETAAPLPAAGAPDATANPGSAAYNQGTAEVTAGTTGTVPRPETSDTTPIRRYRVEAPAGVTLTPHAGHTVQIDGTLKAATAGDATADGEREPVVSATAIRHVSAACRP